jgi:uncharacterized RDD family membrane protein YckC
MRDPYPTLLRRYLGSLIDGLLMLSALIGGGMLIADVGPRFTWLRGAWLGFVLLGYEPLFTSLSATVGRRTMGFRVRRQADLTRPIPIPAAYLRFAVKIVLGVISFFTMSFSRQQRAIHDMATGSVVITWPPDPIPGGQAIGMAA